MKHLIKIAIAPLLFHSCGSDSLPKEEEKINEKITTEIVSNAKTSDRQLNINILWDLSDRIDSITSPASPPHYLRDIEIIKTVTSYFKKDMEKRGAFKAKGRIRIFLTPPPSDSKINSIATNLSYDLAAYTGDGANRKKKEAYDSIETRFSRNVNQIYQLTVANNKNNKQWDGSDIWRFFKNDVKEYCIDPSNNYRNILIILTDGYIYHKDSKDKQNNRTSYILPDLLKVFRNKPNWQDLFSAGNYGLISTRKDLQQLEILVLEITPSKDYKNDEDIIRIYLGKWFEEMGVSKTNYECFNTDLPTYTRKKIENFLNR